MTILSLVSVCGNIATVDATTYLGVTRLDVQLDYDDGQYFCSSPALRDDIDYGLQAGMVDALVSDEFTESINGMVAQNDYDELELHEASYGRSRAGCR
jgi:hypothetical protein